MMSFNHYQISRWGSQGPFQLDAGATVVLDVAWAVGFNGTNTGMENLKLLNENIIEARRQYEKEGFTCLDRNSLGQNEWESDQVIIFPNPGNGQFNVHTRHTVKVSVFSIEGQLVFEKQFEAGTSQLQLNAPPGIYMAQVYMDGDQFYQKLVVK